MEIKQIFSANIPEVFETNKKGNVYSSGYVPAAIEFIVEAGNTSNIELFDALYLTINAGDQERIWTYQDFGYEIRIVGDYVRSDEGSPESFSLDSDSSVLFPPREARVFTKWSNY